jgi:soluble lytic murein transglycosylase-like protein
MSLLLPADLFHVRSLALALLFAAAARPQSPQELSIARQRDSIQRQLAALAQQDGPLARQAASIQKQRNSVSSQPTRSWLESPPPAPPTPTSTSSLCLPVSPSSLDPIVERAAASNALSPNLLRAVIRRESAFQPCAISPAGALGLMQLMPSTAAFLGVDDPFDPAQNIAAGSRFLRQLLDRFDGDLSLALGAYNAGPTRVQAAGAIPEIPETQSYVQTILNSLR